MTLRFYGEDLDIAELTRLLGVEPTEVTRKGEVRRNGRVITESSWRYSVEHRVPGNVESQVSELFERMTDDLEVWHRLNGRYQGDLFCGLFMEQTNEVFGLGPTTLTQIAERGLRLEFDLYDRVTGK